MAIECPKNFVTSCRNSNNIARYYSPCLSMKRRVIIFSLFLEDAVKHAGIGSLTMTQDSKKYQRLTAFNKLQLDRVRGVEKAA